MRNPWRRGQPNGVDALSMPLIDEHEILIAGPPAVVWRALTAQLAAWNTRDARTYARIVGASPGHAIGVFPSIGSSVPGFGVSEADPPRRLVLVGRHHFSRYALVFLIEPQQNGVLMRARSHAEFPGARGSLYRLAVIHSGAHRIVTRRLLRQVRSTARVG